MTNDLLAALVLIEAVRLGIHLYDRIRAVRPVSARKASRKL